MLIENFSIIIFVGTFSEIVSQLAAITVPSVENHTNVKLAQLVQQINTERPFQNILLLKRSNATCLEEQQWFYNLPQPKMLLTETTTFEYQRQHNSELLAILCLRNVSDFELVLHLANALDQIRQIRILILVKAEPAPSLSNQSLSVLFYYCYKLQLLNILLLYETEFARTQQYHQYTPFPTFTLEHWHWNVNSKERTLYPNRFRDLKGYKLRTLADHIEPRSMQYYDKDGELRMNGYMGRFVLALAYKHNAQLVFPYNISNDFIVFYRDIVLYMRNYSLDVPASLTSISPDDDPHECSYPLEISKWCMLLPVEKPIEFRQLYLFILKSNFVIVTCLLIGVYTLVFCLALRRVYKNEQHFRSDWPSLLVNDVAMRGVLGQSFIYYIYNKRGLSLIYCSLFLSGVTVSTLFGSYLQSYLTQPPSEPLIRTYDDLLHSNLKVLISQQEFDYMRDTTSDSLAPYYSIFKVLRNFSDFSDIRDSFDRSYAYPATSSKWPYYRGKQNFYALKVLRYAQDMCPNGLLQLCVSLSLNSIFRAPVESLIFDVLESGLFYYWLDKSYDDVVETGKKFPVDWTMPPATRPLVMNDLFWIWIIYLVLISFSILVFVLELIGHNLSKREIKIKV